MGLGAGKDRKSDSCYFAIYTESSEKLKLSIQGIDPPVICPGSHIPNFKEVCTLHSLIKHTQLGAAFGATGETGSRGKKTANRKSAARVQRQRHDVNSTKI